MKIGVIKFGKVTFFQEAKWSVKGGDNQSIDIINMLLDDGHQVYMLSMSDVQKCKTSGILPPDRKVYDSWYNHRQMKQILSTGEWPLEQQHKNLDAVIIFNGGMPNNAYPLGYNPYGLKTLQMYQRYVFPPIKLYQRYCDYWKYGSIYLLVDNRYYPKLYNYCNPWNMSNPPKRILSQANEVVTLDRKHGGAITYTASHDQLECIFMYKRKPVIDVPKQNLFVMFQHASGIPKWRWEQLQKYVFDLPFEFNIFGDWHDNVGKGLQTEAEYNNGIFKYKNAQFNNPLPLMTDMHKMYQKSKYTFVCSKGSTAQRWSTAKYLEAIMNGCIPFVPRDDYDCEGVSIPLDSFLRVSNCIQLKQKISHLEGNKQAYSSLLNQLVSEYCSEQKLNGKFLLNKFYKAWGI